MTPRGSAAGRALPSARFLDARIQGYLERAFPARLTRVEVTTNEVKIRGQAGGGNVELWLAESPLWQHVTEVRSFVRVRISSFTVKVAPPR